MTNIYTYIYIIDMYMYRHDGLVRKLLATIEAFIPAGAQSCAKITR